MYKKRRNVRTKFLILLYNFIGAIKMKDRYCNENDYHFNIVFYSTAWHCVFFYEWREKPKILTSLYFRSTKVFVKWHETDHDFSYLFFLPENTIPIFQDSYLICFAPIFNTLAIRATLTRIFLTLPFCDVLSPFLGL